MFETIEKESRSSGGGGPQWMSSHPNPGNRTLYINKEAEALTIAGAADDSQFTPIKTAFAGMPAALTMAELAKRRTEGPGDAPPSVGRTRAAGASSVRGIQDHQRRSRRTTPSSNSPANSSS